MVMRSAPGSGRGRCSLSNPLADLDHRRRSPGNQKLRPKHRSNSSWILDQRGLVNGGEYYPRGGLEYLDYIVGNCTELGIYVIMDLHGGPGSQFPGQQYTGHVLSSPGFYTGDNYERAYKFLEWMTERAHTNPAYFNVGMLQVINEPVHAGDYPSQAANMIANYYPGAWNRIRGREAQLGIADSDKLHIQFMATLGAPVIPIRTYLTLPSLSTMTTDT